MTIAEIIKAVEELSAEELRQLRQYIEQHEQQMELRAGTVDIAALLDGLEEIREGLSVEEFAEIERAMNEYPHPSA